MRQITSLVLMLILSGQVLAFDAGSSAGDDGTSAAESATAVEIDIKPGEYPNEVDLRLGGPIPVAIFSSEQFDAASVNPATLNLAGAGVMKQRKTIGYYVQKTDVDKDGLADLVFWIKSTDINPDLLDEGYAILTGNTYDGKAIKGKDDIVIVPRLRQGLILNEDCAHFWDTRTPEEMTLEGLYELVDQYASTQVSHIFFNINSQKTNYKSKVWENFWDDTEPNSSLPEWVHNQWLLDQRGLDAAAVWIARCREIGISPWVSIRMNDVHYNGDISHWTHSSFWRNHPEYWLAGSIPPHIYYHRELNYAIEAVRDHYLALIRECLERYDADGLELDWMREPYNFASGEFAQGREILREFMLEVRELADQQAAIRGHPVKIAVRVPAVPDAALGWGLDAVAWAQSDLIDTLIVSPRFASSDFDIPIERWRKLLGQCAKRITIAAGMEFYIHQPASNFWMINSIEPMRGFTAATLERGADQVYLFNHMDDYYAPDDYRAILTEAGQMKTVVNKSRRHIITFHDISPPSGELPRQLPAEVTDINDAQFDIYIGQRPSKGTVLLRVGLADSPDVNEARLAASLNSANCNAVEDLSPQFGCVRVMQFAAPLAAVQQGYNHIEIYLKQGGNQRIIWMEIYIVPLTDTRVRYGNLETRITNVKFDERLAVYR